MTPPRTACTPTIIASEVGCQGPSLFTTTHATQELQRHLPKRHLHPNHKSLGRGVGGSSYRPAPDPHHRVVDRPSAPDPAADNLRLSFVRSTTMRSTKWILRGGEYELRCQGCNKWLDERDR